MNWKCAYWNIAFLAELGHCTKLFYSIQTNIHIGIVPVLSVLYPGQINENWNAWGYLDVIPLDLPVCLFRILDMKDP